MAYIYCIRHDNIGYIGKDSHSVSSLDRILAHVTNAFSKNTSDSAAYTINKWGYSGNVWRTNDDISDCFGVGEDAYKEFVQTGWTSKTDDTGARLNFAEMVYTLGYSNSYASLNYIVGGTASRGQTPWVYDLSKDEKFREFQRSVKTLKVQVPSFSMNGKDASVSLDGRTIKWGDSFKFAKEDLKLEVHWQNLEDARTKLLHPYQYGVTRYICDSLSAFLSTDIDILKYLIIKETSCFLIKNDSTQSDLPQSIRQITKSIYTQIANEAQKINSNFYIDSALDLTIFEALKPVIADVVNRINQVIKYGKDNLQDMARRYREGVRTVKSTGKITKEAIKTFKIEPSKGFYRIPQNVYDTPKWYKMAMSRLSGGNWITVDETADEVKVGILKTAYKHFKEVVLTSMEPIEGASLSNTESAEGHYKLLVKADKTLLEKVKDNWNNFLGLPVTSEWPIAGRLLISTVMIDIGIPLHKYTFQFAYEHSALNFFSGMNWATYVRSDDTLRVYAFAPATWNEIVKYYDKGVNGFARPENWIYF